MQSGDSWVVVGLDNGGNKNNATVLDASGRFLVEELLESPSRVTEGPDVAVEARCFIADQREQGFELRILMRAARDR